ncbi:hypothetical protein EDD86DRAFT_150322 [Gorgonomyces haynaldii]|nr:hypothetical protein EDD86DRAFT_150322 [Gorgonomyces haynaldii]
MNSKSYSRKRSDYATIACLFGVLLGFSEALYLERSQTQDRIYILQACNLFGLSDETVIWAVWFLVAVLSLSGITSGLWFWMRSVNPAVTPETHFWRQFETISVNMFLLSAVQAFGDYCAYKFGVFKITRDHLDPWSILKDSFFWILCFELAWYTQHRMMHDVKFLWIYGHAYHHQWKKPEHMIGITVPELMVELCF